MQMDEVKRCGEEIDRRRESTETAGEGSGEKERGEQQTEEQQAEDKEEK